MKYLLLTVILLSGCYREAAVSAANIKVMADKQLEILGPNKDKNSENAKILASAIKIEAGTAERVLGRTEAPTLSATMSAVEMKTQVEYREKIVTENNWGWVSGLGATLLLIAGFAVKAFAKNTFLGNALTSVVTAVQEYKESVRETRPALATQLSKTLEKHSNDAVKKAVTHVKGKLKPAKSRS
jgi:hypothetical protein